MKTSFLQRLRQFFVGDDTDAAQSNEPVVVYTAANSMEAELVRAQLASEGISAFPAGEALGSVYGLTVGSLATVKVFVARELAERAKQVIEASHEVEEVIVVDEETGGSGGFA